jgi:hypothetical protein
MADGEDHFELDALDVAGQLVQLGLAFGTQVGLVEVEQGVGGQGHFLRGGLGRGGGAGAALWRERQPRGGSHLALGIRSLSHSQPTGLAVHDAFGQGRGPVAGAPAQAGTALDDDAARVDGVGHDIAGLQHRGVLGEGGSGESEQRGEQQRMFGVLIM